MAQDASGTQGWFGGFGLLNRIPPYLPDLLTMIRSRAVQHRLLKASWAMIRCSSVLTRFSFVPSCGA